MTSQPQDQQSTQTAQKNGIAPLFTIVAVLLVLSFAVNIILFASLLQQFSLPSLSSFSEVTTKQEVLQTIKDNAIVDLPSSDKIYEYETKGLVNSLEDPYSEFLSASDAKNFQDSLNERYEGIGVRFEFDRGQVVVTGVIKDGPAYKSGVTVGDVIYKVEDTLVSDLPDSEIGNRVRGDKGTSVKLVFLRDGKEIPLTIQRDAIETPLVELELKGNVAVIRISSFGENLDVKMADIAKQIQAKGSVSRIVIDLRGNTGGILSETIDIASYFVPEKTLLLYEKTRSGREDVYSIAKAPSLQQYPLSILVDGSSASASEILAGALRVKRNAELVGQPTFGKGVVQQIFSLKSGDQLKLTIAKWFLPDDSEIDKKGLQPDTLLRPSEDALTWVLENRK